MGGRNQLHLEYAYAIISILSSATMWACFRLIKRHGNTPRANSYMTLSQIAIGEGSGFFRFLVLRFFPPLVVLTGEAAILAKWKSSVNQQIICLSVSALLYVSLSYVPPLIRGFTFGERFLSLTLILAYPVLAFLIGAMTQCIDFSQFAPSNLQTMIDGIWQTFITAIIVITFYELLRNYPEEKYIEQDELYDRKSQIVIRIYSAIAEMKQRYTPRVISQFRRQVFVGTSTSEKAEKMLPIAWSELDSLPQDTPVIVGLDQRDYGKPIRYEELYEDLLFDNKGFKSDLIIGAYMDNLLKKNPSGLPMYKYLLLAKIPVTGEKIRQNIKEYCCYDAYLSPSNKKDQPRYRKRLKEKSVDGLISTFGKKTAFKHLTCLYEDEIDPDCLYKYLREVACSDVPEDRRNKLESMLEDSEMRRCIRIYDYLTYGKQYLNKNSASTVAANSASLSGQEEHLATQ